MNFQFPTFSTASFLDTSSVPSTSSWDSGVVNRSTTYLDTQSTNYSDYSYYSNYYANYYASFLQCLNSNTSTATVVPSPTATSQTSMDLSWNGFQNNFNVSSSSISSSPSSSSTGFTPFSANSPTMPTPAFTLSPTGSTTPRIAKTYTKQCSNCFITESCQWRNVTSREGMLCNACFTYRRKYKKNRPTAAIEKYRCQKREKQL
ncbi:Protein CBG18155 [Caenorhabditis briggsae]|uniref:GATA-type domain-containing protein n=2 Tax=Caenorhabditis briggsae TaxID=6238 RepID=A0AAE9JAG5_CAEBR|nr:Protein CBG18155 [Caenorhabditis briggsae]ULU00521.1 hypothetical protein L3Y34_001171 [Caenorhabditis briggsae]UMM23190.1 hypothetical protein L5515_004026 [Caenorhabditis briggsae]CAP35656.1 Protein CBG18155 [Caenorhabditis briggsae]